MWITGVRTKLGRHLIAVVWVVMALQIGVMVGGAGCERQEPIKIGFVGGLTGRLADLGVAGRNGVILAVEQVNRTGGIGGRPVVLVVKDDRQDPQTARRMVRELIAEGVTAIIGPMTSAMAVAVLPVINRRRVVMISPTASSNKLSGRDDFFFRVMSPNKSETDDLARYAFNRLGLRRVAAVYDLSNRAYSEEFFRNFKQAFVAARGRVVAGITFTSGAGVDFTGLVRKMLSLSPDGVLLVTGAVDGAMIAQQLKKQGSVLTVISSGWAMTAELIHNGGPAVEGVVFSQLINTNLKTERYLRFKSAFRDRFGRDPGFAAIHGYDSARVMFKALQRGPAARLKQTIVRIGRFQGVQGVFRIDGHGDAVHRRFLLTVRQGRFAIKRR